MNKPSNTTGFTLLELMIVVGIIATLAMIAVPSYHAQIARSNRTEAKSALGELSNKQEVYFLQHDKYSNNVKDKSGLGYGSEYSQPGNYYKLTTSACKNGDLNVCYEVTATASADLDAKQFKSDTVCRKFVLDSGGTMSAFSADNQPTTDQCW